MDEIAVNSYRNKEYANEHEKTNEFVSTTFL